MNGAESPEERREVTQVREVTERREIVTAADTSAFQKKLDDINSFVLTQFSKVFGDLTLLSSRVDTKTPFTVFAQSTKIDQLINPTVKDGMTIANGNLNITDGYIAATGAIISGTTNITSNLTVGGTLIVSGAQTFSGALTLPSFTATSTTATSSVAYGFIAADKGGLVGIGTSSPFAKL
ncbi:MAG: hypothetical protein HYW90_01820, partial [Candidatus Sungbacteria bacterium]|nr:hypothetical protein [Candidatus Sungbacteria bacterium]